jgi:GNAT superfamily N-acetyltransferase
MRRSVLRDGRTDLEVAFAEDDREDTTHLAALGGDGSVLGVLTVFPEPYAGRPGAPAWHLRGMAVDPDTQGRGVGGILLDEAVRLAREAGAEWLWAEGRDTALRFYEQAGWRVEGEGFTAAMGLPHHIVVLDLSQE